MPVRSIQGRKQSFKKGPYTSKKHHILISTQTKRELEELGNMRDTYEDVIKTLILCYKLVQKEEKNKKK